MSLSGVFIFLTKDQPMKKGKFKEGLYLLLMLMGFAGMVSAQSPNAVSNTASGGNPNVEKSKADKTAWTKLHPAEYQKQQQERASATNAQQARSNSVNLSTGTITRTAPLQPNEEVAKPAVTSSKPASNKVVIERSVFDSYSQSRKDYILAHPEEIQVVEPRTTR
jgi:hypothetical protein